jgi:hypothetical protein
MRRAYSLINEKSRVTIIEGGVKDNHAHRSHRLIRLQISLLTAQIDKRTLFTQVWIRYVSWGGGGEPYRLNMEVDLQSLFRLHVT